MTRLHHVNVVCTPDRIDEMVAFYTSVLGASPIPKPAEGTTGGGAWFDIGDGTQLHISERADTVVSPDQHFGIVVDDFTAVLARLNDAAAVWNEQPDLFGGRRGWTRDPAGNRVEILEAAGELS